MNEKFKVYLETSIVSYLTARPSRDLVTSARQEMTYEWWQIKESYLLYVSELVLEEAQQGDPVAAALRLEEAEKLPLLKTSSPALLLAENLIQTGAVPSAAPRDALHVGIATVHGMDFLLTWNFRHLANPRKVDEIRAVVEAAEFRAPVILTPENLLEER